MERVLLLVLISLLATASVPAQEITPLPLQATPLKTCFNQESAHPRLIGVYSPTCAHCLNAVHDIQRLLEEYPEAQLRVILLWSPFMEADNIGQAKRAAQSYIPDERAVHFWDLWRYGSRSFSEMLRIPPANAFGFVTLYEPDTEWKDELPKPDFWCQNRNLMVGSPFSKKLLEIKLKNWLE